MTEHLLQAKLMALITNLGDVGVFVGMFLESSVVPIPSDAEHGAADATATEEASEKARQQSLS